MNGRRKWRALLLSSALFAGASHAQGPEHDHVPMRVTATDSTAQSPGSTLPLSPVRDLRIKARKGTWLSLDISPDGRTIMFDMLGDLYAMPIKGGRARQITHGLSFDTQPTYSRNGANIAFISDRSGADNLWIARPDGSQARQISFNGDATTLISPAWSANGEAIFVSRYRADLNNVELWRYDLQGAASLVSPIRAGREDPRDQWASTLGATASPDGQYLYFAKRVGGLNFDEQDAWTIRRRDLGTGEETAVIVGPGGRAANRFTYFRPALSPDGRLLAYRTRTEDGGELRLRNLRTGADRLLTRDVDRDALEASLWQDIAPRYAFTPDGKTIVIAHDGVFEQISVDAPKRTVLPFEAAMRVAVGPSTRQELHEETGPITARLIQAPSTSPGGERVAFSALGGLYVQGIEPGAKPEKLPTGPDPVFQPSWSPDGARIAYVSWSEGNGGQIWTIAADGSSPPVQLSRLPAYYSYPVFTPDGQSVVAVRSALAARQRLVFEFGKVRDAELIKTPLDRHTPPHIIMSGRIGGRPQFTASPHEVYVLSEQGLNAVDMSTGATRLVASVKGPGYYFIEGAVPVDDIQISPDGAWLLAQVVEQLYLLPTPAPGTVVDLTDPKTARRRISDIGANFFEWSKDSIAWSVGAQYHRLALSRATPIESTATLKPDLTIPLTVRLPRPTPKGSLVLRGARLLTMANNDRVIDDADILVSGDRILAVGKRGSIAPPPDATIFDVSGKTILPGFVDEHDHIGEVRRDVLSTEDWGLRARLAYGVTTSFDPSTLSIDMLAYQDMLDAGLMLGPRLRSTGPALFSMERISSLDDARRILRRYRDAYRLGNIKEYRTGNRRVREWVAMAARDLGLQPTTEGALSLKLDLSQILDGFAGNEHALAAPPLGDDVISLLVAMRTSYSATLSITNSGPGAIDWFAPRYAVSKDDKLRRFWPPFAIDAKLSEHSWRPLSKFAFPAIAADVARVAAAGGLVGMGSHGELPGIGFHWEMEAHALGGMAPMAILHAATAGSAETIGRLDDLGTIEPGKLADLVILNSDPSNDVRQAKDIHAVMRGGVLYAGQTLDELWPVAKPAQTPWFATSDSTERPDYWLPAPLSPSH